MKLLNILGLGLSLWCLSPSLLAAEQVFQAGDQVLTDCHQIYNKGIIQAKVVDGYRVHFDKDSRPIRCPPFRWHTEFVKPFGSVSEYRLKAKGKGLFSSSKEIVFKVGEMVTLWLQPDKRMVKGGKLVDVQGEITDISTFGAISLKPVSTEPIAIATYWQWIGTNYIDLRHEALEKEREHRVSAE